MKWVWRISGAVIALLVLAFLALRTPDTDPAAMRAKYGGPPSQFLDVGNGHRVHIRDEGPRDAPAIMLLHGSNADLHTWNEWADRLKDQYRVVRFDQIGHGLTGPAPDGRYALRNFTRDVGLVADRMGLERFVLAGNSMGGAIALGYAIEHPERVDALVLIDASGAPVTREGGGNLAFTLARIPIVNRVMSDILPRFIVERSLKQSIANQAIVTPEMIDRYWDLARYPGNRKATIDRFSQPYATFRPGDVRSVAIPTLVLWGEEDALIPLAAARWYSDHLPRDTLIKYPGVGHLPMEEVASRSAADLDLWLSQLRSEGSEREPIVAPGTPR